MDLSFREKSLWLVLLSLATILIELKGTRNASYVLATGVFFAICAALFVDGNFVVTHVLLGFWVIAHLVEIASQLVLYRRGV